MKNDNKILIVGGGPTGLTLACALAKAGMSSRIIDKRDMSSEIPRAINISQPTLDIFRKLGIENSFWDEGLKLDELTVYWKKERLLKLNYNHVDTDYPYFFHLEQSRVEIYLNELLAKYGNSIERQVSLEDLEQHKDKVTVTLKKPDNTIEKSNFSLVVGCDGGNSKVRELANIHLEEKKYSSYFVLTDSEITNNFEQHNLRYYLNDEGYLILVPLPKNKYRIIASFNGDYPGNDKLNLSRNYLQKILDERGPGTISIKKIFWTTSGSFFHKLAHKAKSGRIFIAGDALHQFSPVGGTNMNTGIQDAYSLANKISLSNDEMTSVMDDYEFERLDVAKIILKETEKATRLLTRNGISAIEESKYLPLMKNRKFIKYSLPKLFSCIDIQNSNFN